MSRRGWLLFIAMGVIWGIPYLLIKVAVADLHPTALVLFRTVIGALLLIPWAAAQGWLRPLLPHWRAIIVYTAVEVALPWFLISDAERRLSSSLTGLLLAVVPSVGAVLVWLSATGDRIDSRRIAGLGLGFLGVAALVGLDVSFRDLGAVGEVLLVAVGYAVGPMIIARRLNDLPPVGVVAASLGLTTLAYLHFGLLQFPSALPPVQVVVSVAILGVVCTALAFLLFFALIAEVGPARATVITYVNPAVALLLGVLILGEPFTLGAGAGFLLIVLGSYLATKRSQMTAAAL
ncbi:MAG TPA: DMT family transporter [Candidatus Dormibacteraeota bacterium]